MVPFTLLRVIRLVSEFEILRTFFYEGACPLLNLIFKDGASRVPSPDSFSEYGQTMLLGLANVVTSHSAFAYSVSPG